MPRAPVYNPTTQGVAPIEARFRAPSGPTGGEMVARALDGAGQALQRHAEVKNALAIEQDKTDAGNNAVAFQDAAGQILAKAKASRGIDAGAAYKAAEGELLSAREQMLGQARSPRARELLKMRTDAFLASYRAELAEHEISQTRAAAEESYISQAAKAREEAARQWLSADAVNAQIELGRGAIRDKERLLGRDEASITQAEQEYESSVHRGIVEERNAQGDIDGALDYGKAHLTRMTLGDKTAVSATLRGAIETRQAAGDAQWAISQGGPVPASTSGAKYSAPVRNGRVTSGYGVDRGKGRSHNGTDFAAPEGSPVTPIAGGVVVGVGSDAKSGNYVMIDHGNGLTTSYAHLGGHSVKQGDRVTATTTLGPVGMTGRTTGPHVHVVARQNGKPVDPLQFIGQNAPSSKAAGEWDKRSAYAAVDASDWTFERKQRAKQWIDSEFSRKDSIDAREEREADDEAKKVVLGLGDNFKSLDQIPKAVRDRMSIDATASFSDMAKANSAPKPVAANGAEFLRLQRLAIEAPEQFAGLDLTRSASQLTPGELARLDADQAKIQRGGNEVSIRSAIAGHINTFATPDMHLTGDKNKADFIETFGLMQASILQATGGKRMPTDKELEDAFSLATRMVVTKRPGLLWGTNDKSIPAHDLTVSDIPQATLGQIDAALRRNGVPVTDANRIVLYVEGVSGQ